MSFPILKNHRLTLRSIKQDDAAFVYFMRTDTKVNQFIIRKKPKNKADAQQFIADRQADFKNEKAIYWMITHITHPEIAIGSISLWNFSTDRNTAELGYDLHPDYHSKGIMNESVKLVLAYGFNALQLQTIEAYTHKENRASIRLLKRNKFSLLPHKKDIGLPHNSVFSLTKNNHYQ